MTLSARSLVHSLAIAALAGALSTPLAIAASPPPRPTAEATPAAVPTPATTPRPSGPVSRLLAAINHDRALHHVPPLALDKRESACSLRHTRHMIALGAISHDQFPADICEPTPTAGENVGVAYGHDPLIVHRMMMAEGPCPHPSCPNGEYAQHGHYLNLLNPRYTRIGIGIVFQNGFVWLTEDFLA